MLLFHHSLKTSQETILAYTARTKWGTNTGPALPSGDFQSRGRNRQTILWAGQYLRSSYTMRKVERGGREGWLQVDQRGPPQGREVSAVTLTMKSGRERPFQTQRMKYEPLGREREKRRERKKGGPRDQPPISKRECTMTVLAQCTQPQPECTSSPKPLQPCEVGTPLFQGASATLQTAPKV